MISAVFLRTASSVEPGKREKKKKNTLLRMISICIIQSNFLSSSLSLSLFLSLSLSLSHTHTLPLSSQEHFKRSVPPPCLKLQCLLCRDFSNFT